MGQINFEIRLNFDDAESAESVECRLRDLDNDCRGNLAQVLVALLGNTGEIDDEIDIENISRDASSVCIHAYGGRSAQPPFPVAARFHELGCASAYLRAFYDDGDDSAYFIGAKRVDANTFARATRPATQAHSAEYLFLPQGKVQVDARLLDFEWRQDMKYRDYCLMKFETADGNEFYYQGRDKKLLKLTEHEYEPTCSFVASFEEFYLDTDSPPVSLAIKPSKVVVTSIDPRRSALQSLRGYNLEFAQGPLVEILRRYFEDCQVDCNTFFRTLAGNSFLGIGFSELLSKTRDVTAESFRAFGLYVRATPTKRTRLTIECGKTDVKIDFKGLIRHVRDLGVEFLTENRDWGSFTADWVSDEAYLQIRIDKSKLLLEISRLLDVCAGGKSVKEQYQEFMDEPGLASKVDWLKLFELAKSAAESGEVDSMKVYAALLDSGRAWERRPDEAAAWRERAALQGDPGAYLQMGSRLDPANASTADLEKALDYFRAGGELGNQRCWDEYEKWLKLKADKLKSYAIERRPFPDIDTSHWQVEDKNWMRERGAAWNRIEPMYGQHAVRTELAAMKKYFMTGTLPLEPAAMHDWGFGERFNLLEFLWLHPSRDPSTLRQLRTDYLSHVYSLRRKFHDWQGRLFSSIFVLSPLLHRAGEDFPRIYTDDNLLLFKTIYGDLEQHGYWVHGVFIPFARPRHGYDELSAVGIWFCHDELDDINRGFVYQDETALNWWYDMLPAEKDFFSRSPHDGKLPYIFLSLYRLCHFEERGIECPARENFAKRLIAMLDEKPFIEYIQKMWRFVKQSDITIDGAWDLSLDARDIYDRHKDRF